MYIFKEVSYAYKGCIYLIKNTVKIVIVKYHNNLNTIQYNFVGTHKMRLKIWNGFDFCPDESLFALILMLNWSFSQYHTILFFLYIYIFFLWKYSFLIYLFLVF